MYYDCTITQLNAMELSDEVHNSIVTQIVTVKNYFIKSKT